MQYPNLPNSDLEITSQPEVKEITNELLKQLQSALNSNTLFTEQVELSLKGIVRILEVLLSLDFFKNANEIDSSLRNSIEWLSNAGESLKNKMKEYEGFFNNFNTSMKSNEQEVTEKEPDITLIFKDQGKEVKKEHIKAFQGDPKTIYYFLVTQDNDNKLITGLRTSENYIKAEIDKADTIHSFIPQTRTLKE
ncbi:DUF1542 domain-containing protein [Helicobacter pylori]|uniref:DUF1542 domain-containing protein n=1 Tax=Helicobacter pylori TaxID=210 RepID=UPI001FD232E3|nr:DUF1542 domain-containing protein [Helicobacter pylori]UOS18161.1 DUF1542 domain-containing protein [Helicobacter pylori]